MQQRKARPRNFMGVWHHWSGEEPPTLTAGTNLESLSFESKMQPKPTPAGQAKLVRSDGQSKVARAFQTAT